MKILRCKLTDQRFVIIKELPDKVIARPEPGCFQVTIPNECLNFFSMEERDEV